MSDNTIQDSFVKARQDLLKVLEDYKKINNNFLEFASPLQQIHLENCKLIYSREALLRYLPQNSIVAEVGTQTGYFARKIIDITQPSELHTIDINWSIFEKEKFLTDIETNILHIYEGDSVEVLSRFPNEYFDWIYIDADHSYEGVYRDIQCAAKKVKSNGILVFNDYTVWSPLEAQPYGIMRAVNEFCINQGWEFIFFALATSGYHDVAIRKIGCEKSDYTYPINSRYVSSEFIHDIVQLQFDKAVLSYKLHETKQSLEYSQLQLKTELEAYNKQLQQHKIQEEIRDQKLQEKDLGLQAQQFQLEKTKLELDYVQKSLAEEIKTIQNIKQENVVTLEKIENEFMQSRLQVKALQERNELLQNIIDAMESSKFWKIRKAWFVLKRMIGLSK
jgi:predicted O-methyltransferase YrrM